MARGVNKVTLLGNLGKDPEVKYTPGGMAVAKFSLATGERRKDKEGNWQDHTEWHNLVAFGKTAEVAGEYLKKGKQVFIEGTLRTSSWDDKESGAKKYKTEIVVNELIMLGGAGGGGEGGGSSRGRGSAAASSGNDMDQRGPAEEAVGSTGITDEDIPF